MQTSHQDIAHSFYVLYQALPQESKQLFLQELLGEQAEQLVLSLPNHWSHQPQLSQKEDPFADICGILKATRSVSLEEIGIVN